MRKRLLFLLAWSAFSVHLQSIWRLQIFSTPGELQCQQILSISNDCDHALLQ